MMKLNLNFVKEEMSKEFNVAVQYESVDMMISSNKEELEKLEKKLKKDEITPEEETALKIAVEEVQEIITKLTDEKNSLSETHEKVVTSMSEKNENFYGNKKTVVRNVLRVIATFNNSKLTKYALVETFNGATLYNALEAIHINSVANDDGSTKATKEVKEAYKTASDELDNIIKTTFSLSFETPYTEKTRVKMNATDKKLLHDCYIRGFSNKFTENEKTGLIDFSDRKISTAVRSKKDRKTGEITYNYSGLYSIICNIVLKHYFK